MMLSAQSRIQTATSQQGTQERPIGRKTVRQEIDQMRANNPDQESTIGERSDNHVGHGKATTVSIIMYPTRIIDVGNGTWKDISQFERAYTMKGDYKDNPEHYDGTNIGKWGAGLTESSLKDGDKAITMHNFNGELLVTELSRWNVENDNDFLPNVRNANTQEEREFMNYMKLQDPSYIMSCHYGTVSIVESLHVTQTTESYLNMKMFCTGLYDREQYPEVVIQMYNCTDGRNPHGIEPNIIRPLDLSFGSQLKKDTKVHAYRNHRTGKWKYVDDPIDEEDWSHKYHMNMTINCLEAKHELSEREHFDGQTEKRVGYLVYRDGRLITGPVPKLFGFDPNGKQSRGKGIRIKLQIPKDGEYLRFADDNLNIGTNKKLTEDSYGSWNPELKTFFRETLNNASKVREAAQKDLVNEHVTRYKNIIKSGFKSLTTKHEIDVAKQNAATDLEDLKEEGIWSRNSSKLRKFVNSDFNDALDERLAEIMANSEVHISDGSEEHNTLPPIAAADNNEKLDGSVMEPIATSSFVLDPWMNENHKSPTSISSQDSKHALTPPTTDHVSSEQVQVATQNPVQQAVANILLCIDDESKAAALMTALREKGLVLNRV